MRTSRTPPAIDRFIPGIGRLTIRGKKMSKGARDELDRYIHRAKLEGNLEQLRLLKSRAISPLAFLEAARSNNLLRLKPSPEVKPLVARWLAESDLRASSRSRYEQSWSFVLRHLPSEAVLADLNADWWSRFALSREVSNATLNRDRAAVLAFTNWAKDVGLPVVELRPKKLKEEPRRSEILSTEQVQAILCECRPDRLPLFWTLIETGARQGEVLNLDARDVSPREDLLTIRSKPGSKGRGKTRHVPISKGLTQCLRVLGTVAGAGPIFPYSRFTIRDWWADLCAQLRLEGVTLHGIRATFITHALDSGIPPVEVQKMVGHSDITMTMRYYRNTEQSETAARRMRSAMGLEPANNSTSIGGGGHDEAKLQERD